MAVPTHPLRLLRILLRLLVLLAKKACALLTAFQTRPYKESTLHLLTSQAKAKVEGGFNKVRSFSAFTRPMCLHFTDSASTAAPTGGVEFSPGTSEGSLTGESLLWA